MEIRDTDFDEMVLSSDRPVLLDFCASWCPLCKMMQPMVGRLATKVGDWADVYSVNIDRSPGLARQYQVSGVPTFIAFAGGQPIERKTGALTEGQMLELLNLAKGAMPTVEDSVLQSSEEAGHPDRPYITIVSGLPRSGRSMMMRMLAAGGISALTDELRTPDDDNPNGYYEFEDVTSMEGNAEWLDDSQGFLVKMAYSLLMHLPADRDYRIVFMRRDVSEIMRSQKQMLQRNGIESDAPNVTMIAVFERELQEFYAWLPSQTHLNLINVSYNELLCRPETTVDLINRHFEQSLNVAAMTALVDPTLYRHRAA